MVFRLRFLVAHACHPFGHLVPFKGQNSSVRSDIRGVRHFGKSVDQPAPAGVSQFVFVDGRGHRELISL